MSSVSELHNKAMELCDAAFVAKLHKDMEEFKALSEQALEFERQAADFFAARLTPDVEPTRSVLYRSAASIAIDCGNYREAERLIATGLAGYPPEEIAEELRGLLEQVNLNQKTKSTI